MLQLVNVGHKSLADYATIATRGLMDEIRRLAEPLAGKRVVHLSATAFGGGVAEINYTLIPLMQDAGLEVEWRIIRGQEEFFNVTKTIHNALQGSPEGLSADDREVFDRYQRLNADEFDGAPTGLHRRTPVVQVGPARAGEHVAQFLHRQRGALDVLAAAAEVPERVLQHRAGVVVGAEHECARAVQQRRQRAHYGRYRVDVREVVAGDHDEVRAKLRQHGLQRADQCLVDAAEVQVRQMRQHAHGVDFSATPPRHSRRPVPAMRWTP